MLKLVAEATSALALLHEAEDEVWQSSATTPIFNSILESVASDARREFMAKSYAIAFELVGPILRHGPITTTSDVEFSAIEAGGGFVTMSFLQHPGMTPLILTPQGVSAGALAQMPIVDAWIAFMRCLAEILETLGMA